MFAYWIRTFMDGKFIEIEKKVVRFHSHSLLHSDWLLKTGFVHRLVR